ncbi:MAG: Gfo/Idh/MocA family oxidoreductase [Lachnospiraceae bacterium]|nr:Gfo/Idh/MocA family oxidoreductase [Lachnospiraceae bacterium]
MKEVRVGIIGAGMISERHMTIYENMNRYAELLGFRAKVVACAEARADRLKAWGEKYGLEEKDLYTDFRELLKRDDLDTVDVCVHNNLHTPVSIAVMKAGFDCYCEKPAAASYHDAKMMIDCAKKLGRKFHVQISSLMSPQTRVARDMIAAGDLGTPYYVNLEQCVSRRRPGYDLPEFTSDFYSRRVAGHGPSIDLGIYVIGQILFVLGMPELLSVNGFARRGIDVDERLITNPDGFGVEDICDGFAKFENGVGFHYLSTSANHYKDYSMTYILGSKGGLEILDTDMAGGRMGFPGMQRTYGAEPELRFYGDMGGRNVAVDLKCDENGILEQRQNPNMLLYNDNQIMWLAYKLGILTDETRYNTPEVALSQLLFTDGLFLSEELGREVKAEEIKAMSPELYIKEQEIGSEMVKYDVEF